MSETPECGGHAAAYALGAMDVHEAEEFRRDLTSWPQYWRSSEGSSSRREPRAGPG
jgi:hypothetical protein